MVETIRYEESKNVVKTLDESRHLLRDSYDEFKREQVECRKQLEKIIKEKKNNRARQKGIRSMMLMISFSMNSI